jgi:hypothetical protein
VQARNAADGLAHAAQKTLQEAGDKADPEERTAIEDAIKAVEEAVQGDDKEKIDKAAQTPMCLISLYLFLKVLYYLLLYIIAFFYLYLLHDLNLLLILTFSYGLN